MNMPFSRPGAVDLSNLVRPSSATPTAGGPGRSPAGPAGAAGAYAVDVDEQALPQLLDASMTAPVLLVAHSPSQMPQSTDLADDLGMLAGELDGRLAVGRVDVDAQPAVAQAMQVSAVPFVAVLLQGRLLPVLQDVLPVDELRRFVVELLQQLATQGVTGRHRPFTTASPAAAEDPEPPGDDPRFAPVTAALQTGDLEGAAAELRRLVTANPGDAEAARRLAQVELRRRVDGADLRTARERAAAAPDDVDAQLLVADLDIVGGHVDDAFRRLVELVRRTVGGDRDRVRVRLLELFDAVGAQDARVLKARRDLASALF